MVRVIILQFIPLAFRGVGFVGIMLLSTFFALGRGIWDQTNHIANGWLIQMRDTDADGHLGSPMYWLIRIIAIFLMFVCLVTLSSLVMGLVNMIFR